MKLQAKARPVQITKLRLGGYDIKSKANLLDNFCVNEILDLGDKFLQWLRRNDEPIVEIQIIANIFNNPNPQQQALGLIRHYFPEHKKQSLTDILFKWITAGKKFCMVENLLKCIGQNDHLAIKLIKCSDILDKAWLTNWLHLYNNIHSGKHSSDFYYEYSVFLKNINPDTSEELFLIAVEMGNKKAKEENAKREAARKRLEEEAVKPLTKDGKITIEMFKHTMTMVRISSTTLGVYYIAEEPIPYSLYKYLGLGDNESICGARVNKAVSDECLRKFSSNSFYKWRYPTISQWKTADKQGKIIHGDFNAEWCVEKREYENSQIMAQRLGLSSDKGLFELRPILIVSENPSLR